MFREHWCIHSVVNINMNALRFCFSNYRWQKLKSAPEQLICFPLVRAVPQGTLTSARRGGLVPVWIIGGVQEGQSKESEHVKDSYKVFKRVALGGLNEFKYQSKVPQDSHHVSAGFIGSSKLLMTDGGLRHRAKWSFGFNDTMWSLCIYFTDASKCTTISWTLSHRCSSPGGQSHQCRAATLPPMDDSVPHLGDLD